MNPRARLLAALVILYAAGEARADDWWGTDKALHLGVGYGLGAGSYGGLWWLSDDPPAVRIALCTFAASLPGVAKELYDQGRPGNSFSGKDLLWTEVGVLSGVLSLWLVERLTGRRGDGGVAVSPRGLSVTVALE